MKTRGWLWIITIGGLFLVLYLTLFPFDFLLVEDVSLRNIIGRFDLSLTEPYVRRDLFRNVLLFIPFGFGIAGLLKQRNVGKYVALVLTVLVGFTLSLIIEIAQQLSLFRFSSMADIAANCLGALLGYALFYAFGKHILSGFDLAGRKVRRHLSVRNLMVVLLGYGSLVLIVSLRLRQMVNLSNWDQSMPLILGNERNGDRPWQGTISSFQIADKALDEGAVAQVLSSGDLVSVAGDSLVASYDLHGTEPFLEQDERSPEFYWQGEEKNVDSQQGLDLDAEGWLETSEPAATLSQALAGSSQFTLAAGFASAGPEQSGPARIVSLSTDPLLRNFTLGQEGPDLVFRLRTPFSGYNGTKPELVIPGVLQDTEQHFVIVTFDGQAIQFYVDEPSQQYKFEMNPEVTLFWLFPPAYVQQMRLTSGSLLVFKTLYFSLIFIPLAILLALIAVQLKAQPLNLIAIIVGILLLILFSYEKSLLSMLSSTLSFARMLVWNLGVVS